MPGLPEATVSSQPLPVQSNASSHDKVHTGITLHIEISMVYVLHELYLSPT